MRPMVKAFVIPFLLWECFALVLALLGGDDVIGKMIALSVLTPIGAVGIGTCMYLGTYIRGAFLDKANGERAAMIAGATLSGVTPLLIGFAVMRTGGFEAAVGMAIGLTAAVPAAIIGGLAASMAAKAANDQAARKAETS